MGGAASISLPARSLELNDMLTGTLCFSPELTPHVVSALRRSPSIASRVPVA